MPPNPPITRRKLLAAGSVGAVALAGVPRVLSQPIEHDRETLVQSGGAICRIEFTERYNGTTVQTGGTGDAGPIIDIPGAVPGDRGLVHFRLSVPEEEDATAVRPSLQLTRPESDSEAFPENGINEPEEVAGDTSPDVGELQEAVTVTAWYDTGGATSGACDGERDAVGGEPAVAGTDGVTFGEALSPAGLGGEPTTLAAGDPCLEPGESLCVGFAWQFPEGAGNAAQGDGIRFDFRFDATPCG